IARFGILPSAVRPPRRRATSPDRCGAAIEVPFFSSPPASHLGTDDHAKPGVTTCGPLRSPPRLEKNATGSGRPSDWGNPAKTSGIVAPTAITSRALAGNPSVESPGPSFDAATLITTSGRSARTEP